MSNAERGMFQLLGFMLMGCLLAVVFSACVSAHSLKRIAESIEKMEKRR